MPQQEIVLPPPQLSSQNSLEEAIAQRRSHRSFGPRELRWEQIGQLAWSALGVTGGDPRWRSAPSAGALHSLKLYVLLPGSSYHYDPVAHRLVFHQPVLLSEVAAAALNQQFIAQAPCTFAFAVNATRTTQVYKKRGWNYVCMDLGHAAQNLLLQATALGLVGTPVGALDEAALNAILKLPDNQRLLYLVPIGYPG